MTTLTISVPPSTWMSQNRAVPNHHARRAKVDGIHRLTLAVARQQGLQPIPTPVRALWTIAYPKGTGPADPVNAAPNTKAILDALVIGGWLEKDDSKHVVSETFERGPNLTVPTVHTITLALTPIGAL